MRKFKFLKGRKAKEAYFCVFCLLALALSSVFILSTKRALDLVETSLVSVNEARPDPIEATVQKKVVTRITDGGVVPPGFGAQAVLAVDLASGRVLYEKNSHTRLPPASTTKIMTALVALEHFKQADVLKVSPQFLAGGSTMGLVSGEQIFFRGLLYGMMLNSGNDAAYTIAENFPGGLDAFVTAMNKKSEELGLKDTHFQNPAGFDGINHYSSAHDLAKIASIAVSDPQLARVVSTKETYVSPLKGQGEALALRPHHLKNLNKLLSEPGVLGVKTGFTELAGENFVGLVERDGRRVLTVVLKSRDRFGDTKNLMDWVFLNFRWTDTLM